MTLEDTNIYQMEYTVTSNSLMMSLMLSKKLWEGCWVCAGLPRCFLPESAKLHVTHSMIMSVSCTDRIQSFVNSAGRFLNNSKRFIHMSAYWDTVNMFSIETLCRMQDDELTKSRRLKCRSTFLGGFYIVSTFVNAFLGNSISQNLNWRLLERAIRISALSWITTSMSDSRTNHFQILNQNLNKWNVIISWLICLCF